VLWLDTALEFWRSLLFSVSVRLDNFQRKLLRDNSKAPSSRSTPKNESLDITLAGSINCRPKSSKAGNEKVDIVVGLTGGTMMDDRKTRLDRRDWLRNVAVAGVGGLAALSGVMSRLGAAEGDAP